METKIIRRALKRIISLATTFCIFTKYFLTYMKIIIAGGGEVGFHLAKLLSYESLDITLIDTDKQRLTYAENHLILRP